VGGRIQRAVSGESHEEFYDWDAEANSVTQAMLQLAARSPSYLW